MSRRALLIISQHPKVKEYCEEMDAGRKQLKEKMVFLQKQADDAGEDYKKEHKAVMEKIKDYLVTEGIYKDEIDDDKNHLQYDIESDCLELCTHDDSEHPLSAIFSSMFGRRP